jgi:hypothetical protein
MPLKGGSSKETISANIEHCLRKWKETGNVSGSPVESEKKAMSICAAMSYSSARKSADGEALSRNIRKRRK